MSIVEHMVNIEPDLIPIIVHSASAFSKLVDNTEKYIVIVDDFGGDLCVDDAEILEWKQISNIISFYLKHKQIYIIFTASKDVIKSMKENKHWIVRGFVSEKMMDFDDSENALTEKEKSDLCMKYAKAKDISLNKNSLAFLQRSKTSLGIPLLCTLMRSNNVAQVFENPAEVIERQINLVSQDAKSNFTAILLTFLFNGHLPRYELTDYQNACYDKVLSFVKIRKNFNKITDTAGGLVGTILKYNKRLNSYEFLHPSIFQEIMKWFWNHHQEQFLDMCPVRCFSCFIYDRTNSNLSADCNASLLLEPTQYEAVLERFRREVEIGKPESLKLVAASKLWEYSGFVEASVQHLQIEFFFVKDHSNFVLFSYLSELGKYKMVQKIIEVLKLRSELKSFKPDIEKTIESVCRKGMCNMFTLLSELFDKLPSNVFQAIAEGGSVDIMKFIISKGYNLTAISPQDRFSVLQVACIQGHKNLVKYLFNEMKTVPSLRDAEGKSVLHHTVMGGRKGILKLFLSNTEGFDSDLQTRTKSGTTILHTACEYGRLSIVKYLCELYPSMMLSVDQNGLIPAHYTVMTGHTDCLIFLNSQQVFVDNKSDRFPADRRTLLHLACLSGRLGMVKYLCKAFPDMINTENDDALLPVHDAIKEEHTDIIEYLITKVHNPMILTSDGRTLLHVAAYEGKLRAVKYLSSTIPAMLRICDLDGNTAAHDAAASGKVEVLKYLLQSGIDPKSRNCDGCSMLHDAAYFGRLDMVQYLCLQYPNLINICSNTGYTPAHAAALGGSIDVLRYLISLNLDLRVVSQDMSTLLHEAAYSGNLEIVKFLCTSYPELINAKTQNSFTACHYAVQEGHEEVTDYLLGEVCDAGILTDDNETFLHIAAYNGRLAVVKYLCREFSDLTGFLDISGATVLHAAARSGHLETMSYLLDQHTDPNVVTENGSTLLHLAAYDGRLEMVKFLCDKFPSMLLLTDNTDHSAGHYAAGSGNVEVFRYLVSKGIDPVGRTANGSTCLLKAAYTGNQEMVEYLSENIPELLKMEDQYSCNAAHYTACEGHLSVLKYLLSKGVSYLSRTIDGHTILHIAAFHGRLQIVAYLCKEYPEMVPLEDNAGQTVETFAESGGHGHILKYLRKLKGKKYRRKRHGVSHESSRLESFLDFLRQCCSNACQRLQHIVCCCRNE